MAWWTEQDPPPAYASIQTSDDDISTIIECTLDISSPALRDLSLKIHGMFSLYFLFFVYHLIDDKK